MTWSLICLTFGILRVIYHWFPEFLLKSTHVKCSLQVAEKVLIVVLYILSSLNTFHKNVEIWHLLTFNYIRNLLRFSKF